MQRTAVMVVLVGLMLLGAGMQQALGGEPPVMDVCFECACQLDGHTTPAACFSAPIGQGECLNINCPPPGGASFALVVPGKSCDEIPECLALIQPPHLAPALSHIPLAGLGLLLGGGGVWLTRKRTRSPS